MNNKTTVNKTAFLSLCNNLITRDGKDELLDYLENAGFFTAPASTKYHGAYEGGLVEHSLNVFDELYGKEPLSTAEVESIAIVSLFHDVCKADSYTTELKNVKIDGQWIQKEVYVYNSDTLPYGHGEKSVYIINKFMQLTDDEALAIRWHMGAFDSAFRGGGKELDAAFRRCELAVKLHLADMRATYIVEHKK